jgi:hypothetical protein
MESTVLPRHGFGTVGVTEQRQVRIPRATLFALLVAEVVAFAAGANRYFFYFDDIVWQYEARRQPFGLRFVVQPVIDHFAPAYLTAQRLLPPATGYRYWCLALAMALLVGAISVLLWRIAGVFGVPELRRLVLVAAIGTSAVLVEISIWWSMAVHTLPSTALVLAVWLMYAQYLHGRTRGRGLAAALMLFAACAFIEKALVWLPLIPLFDVLVWQRGLSWRDRTSGLVRRWRFHAPLLAAGAGYVAWMYGALATQPHRPPFDLVRYGRFVWLSWYRGFLPMVVDGRGHEPASAITLASLQAVVLAAALVWLVTRPADRAVATWFVIAFAVNQLALVAGRSSFVDGATRAQYHSDSLVALAIAAIVAAVPRRLGPRRRTPRPAAVGAVVGAALLIGGGQIVREYHRDAGHAAVGRRARTAFSAVGLLPADGIPLLDAPFPWDPSAFPYTTPSRWLPMARPAARRPVVDIGVGPFWVVTGSGRFALTGGAPSRAAVRGCADRAKPLEFAVADVVGTDDRDLRSWEIWADVEATTASTITIHLAGEGADAGGPLRSGEWFDPSFQIGGVTRTVAPGGIRRVHIFANPRWHATLQQGRVFVVDGGPVCVYAIGYGKLP